MIGSIVVGTDGSETATQAVKEAVALAEKLGAELRIVSAYSPVSESQQRREKHDAPSDVEWMVSERGDADGTLQDAEQIAKDAGVSVKTFARQGDPSDAILDVAEETKADLVVVGNRGMTGAKRFLLGSVPNKISHHAPCSVLIVRTT